MIVLDRVLIVDKRDRAIVINKLRANVDNVHIRVGHERQHIFGTGVADGVGRKGTRFSVVADINDYFDFAGLGLLRDVYPFGRSRRGRKRKQSGGR